MAIVTETVLSAPVEHPGMSWSAIFAGWFVATAVAGLLYLAGLALGFAAFDPQHVAASGRAIGIGTAIWVIVVWAAGLFVGGMFASWFDGRADDTIGPMHGVAVWGVSLVATALWLSLGLGHAMQHRNGPEKAMVPGTAMAAAAGDNDALLILQANVRGMLDRALGQRGHARPGTDDAVVAAVLANHTDTARALLLAEGASSSEIDQTLPRMATEAIAANRQIKADADRAAHYTSLALWICFLSALIALITSAIGGWLGARNVHRVYHLRRYEGRPFRGS